jgi:hypothetical protein
MAVNPKANLDINNLHPSPTDEAVKTDEALKGFIAELEQKDIEELEQKLAAIEVRMTLAGAGI